MTEVERTCGFCRFWRGDKRYDTYPFLAGYHRDRGPCRQWPELQPERRYCCQRWEPDKKWYKP
jgi:hypothetical protein